MYENARVIHLIRDPRSIFASWKKITYEKNDYWGCIINCIDNMNYARSLQKKISKKKYMVLKFEDVLSKPTIYSKRISNFLKIPFEKKMTEPQNWEKNFKNKYASLGFSSIEKKKMDGFYKNRIDSWKSQLNEDEIKIIEFFSKKNLKYWKYKIKFNSIDKKLINTFIKKKIKKSKYLKKIFMDFINYGKASDKLKHDPLDPKTWGDGQKNKKKFINTFKGKIYLNKIKKIKNKLK